MSDFRINFSLGEVDPATTHAAPMIEFLCDPALAGAVPPPERAIRFAPDWFKRLEREMGMPDAHGLPGLTVKACLPVTDAFALGYVIPLPFDVLLQVPEDRVRIGMGWAEGCPFAPIEQHHPGQIGAPNPPFEQVMPLKFINPWRVKVPDGYSVLFTQPMNRPDLPFTCFSGFVDCDRFATTVNMPFVWTGPTGEHLLRAGTPIAQIIPIRRDTMLKEYDARLASGAEMAEQAAARQQKYHSESAYAREWRVKK